jgi:multidrug efflux pump subunit AcrA (membrane-fusion protein)
MSLMSGFRRAMPRAAGLLVHSHQRAWAALLIVIVVLAGLVLMPAMEMLQPAQTVRVAAVLPASLAEPAPAAATRSAGSGRLVQAPGWLEPAPYPVAVTGLAEGVVLQIHALEGQSVQAGQVVAQLVPDDARLALSRAQANLAFAQAQLQQAQARQRAAQTDWDEPVERQRQVQASTAELAEARAELAQLPSMIRRAQAESDRAAELHQQLRVAAAGNATTQRELVVAQQEAAARAAALDETKARQPILQARVERLEAQRVAAVRAAELRVEERRALDVAVAQVADAQAAVDQARVAIDEAQLRLERMTIRAPHDGQVMRRLKQPGDKIMLSSDDPVSAQVLWIYDPASMQVRVDVPLADAAGVQVGQPCEVIVDVLPDRTFTGQVTRVTHEADLQKNTLQVKVQVHDPAPVLRPQMLTRVRFMPGGSGGESSADAQAQPLLRVPVSCLDGDRVWVVRERRGLRGAVVPVSVQVRQQDADFARVSAALHPGDLLVQSPADLAAGRVVRIQPETGGDA